MIEFGLMGFLLEEVPPVEGYTGGRSCRFMFGIASKSRLMNDYNLVKGLFVTEIVPYYFFPG